MASDRGVEGDHGGRVVGRRVLVEALVWPVVIEMVHILVEDGAGMSRVVEQHPVGALLANGPNESFGVTVCLRGLRRDSDHVDAFGGDNGVERGGELGVSVADEEAERGDPFAQVPQQVTGGLGSPGRGRVGGHTEDVDSSGTDFHRDQDVESAQRDGVEGKEIGGEQPDGLSAEKDPPAGVCPAWCWAEAGGGQDPADGARAQAVSESEEFALDASVAPGRIFLCQS